MFSRGRMTLSLRALALGTAAASALLIAGPASAQSGPGKFKAQSEPDLLNPPEMKKRPKPLGHPSQPDGYEEIRLDLNIEYVDGKLYNPKTGVDDPVRLRAYVDPGQPLPEHFVAPSIITKPGDTLRIALNNKLPNVTLPLDPGCASTEHNKPHCFNGTNLHFHGLNVNPSGNGDNVLLSINPGVKFEYEVAIAPEHPAGTFWYHTHRHGSTSMQVSSGMAGALLIKGNRVPTATAPGDLDVLIDGVRNVRDRTLIFQQIHYACLDQNNDIKYTDDGTFVTGFRCDPGDVGGVEVFRDSLTLGFGLNVGWGLSGRYTTINGRVIPTFHVKQGQLERWRMIHGGVRDTIRTIFVKANGPSIDPRPEDLSSQANVDGFIQANCGTTRVPYSLVAADGLTMNKAITLTNATLQPGYRWDALVRFPEAGEYCMIDINSQASESVGNLPSFQRLLGIVKVEADASTMQRGDTVAQLVDSARKTMPADVRDAVIADLNNGLTLSRFSPHKPIAESELSGGQDLTFDITTVGNENFFHVANQLPTSPNYNPQPYNPARLDRKLTLGTAEEWRLTSNRAGHPFHIHVNPFEIVKIVRNAAPTVDLSAPGAVDLGNDPQYPGLKGVFKDTIWVKPGYTVTIRTRYERYIGEFVLHCHILDHEDEGMMQNVAVVLPGGHSSSVNAPPADAQGIH